MKFKKSQSGRSMVEMLGVLAIIGVLSVGGIAGYSLSMRRHRANGIIDLMSKYALVGYSQCQKKLLDGELNSQSNLYCDNSTTNLTFDNAGIGTRPAVMDEYVPFVVSWHPDGDVVHVSATVDDDKLCQAIASSAGGHCDEYNNVYITIKQN